MIIIAEANEQHVSYCKENKALIRRERKLEFSWLGASPWETTPVPQYETVKTKITRPQCFDLTLTYHSSAFFFYYFSVGQKRCLALTSIRLGAIILRFSNSFN